MMLIGRVLATLRTTAAPSACPRAACTGAFPSSPALAWWFIAINLTVPDLEPGCGSWSRGTCAACKGRCGSGA